MSYLLVMAISLIFLFLWSKLPDPTGPQPETLNSFRDSNGMQSVETGETPGPKLHPSQLGEPDDHGRIRVFAEGDAHGRATCREAITVPAVRSVQGVRGTYADGDRHVPVARRGARHDYLERAIRYDHPLRDERQRRQALRKEGSETMNCPRCGNDQWGKSRDSFGHEDMVCVTCGLLGRSATGALVHDWASYHEPPEDTVQAVSDFHLAG
jgi:hypothetical protein